MSLICCIQSIDANEIDKLLSDPPAIYDVLKAGENCGLDLDKSWHAIHYMLTDSPGESEEPGCFLLHGGEQVGEEDVGYGPARIFRPQDVQRFDSVLQQFDESKLRRRYNPLAMARAHIYPNSWIRKDGHENDVEYLLYHFRKLREFVARVAQDESGLIVSIR